MCCCTLLLLTRLSVVTMTRLTFDTIYLLQIGAVAALLCLVSCKDAIAIDKRACWMHLVCQAVML